MKMAWGKNDRTSSQGWAKQIFYDKRYWTCSWSGTYGSMYRDGKITLKNHAWCSENNIDVIYPYAVMDDFGMLVPVSYVFVNPFRREEE